MGWLDKIASTDICQRFYKWGATEKGQRFLAERLPSVETVVASSLYVASTYHQYKKGNVDKRRHSLLQCQNVLSGVCGFTIGSWASKKTSNYINNKVMPDLKPELIPDIHKVKMGLQVAIPLVTTCLIVRGVIPAVLAWISAKREEKIAEKKALEEQKKINKLNKLA